MLGALSAHLDDSHHAEIFVIQDVTMIDGSAGEVLKRDPNPHTFTHGHIEDISPSREARLPIIFAHDLERVGVDMKRVIEIHHHHSASVNDLPLLDGSNLDVCVSSFRVERQAVDRKLHPLHTHHAASEHQPALSDRFRQRLNRHEAGRQWQRLEDF
jgi:hypothetical protein